MWMWLLRPFGGHNDIRGCFSLPYRSEVYRALALLFPHNTQPTRRKGRSNRREMGLGLSANFGEKGGGGESGPNPDGTTLFTHSAIGCGEREDGQVAVHQALRGAHRGDQEAQDGGTVRGNSINGSTVLNH